MIEETDTDQFAKYVCHDCIGEPYLKEEIRREGVIRECSYCGDAAETVPIEDVADRIELAFEGHYIRTSDQPTGWQLSLMADRESSYNWNRDGEPVLEAIASAAETEEEVARDIQEILEDRHGDMEMAAMGEETEFSSGTCYEIKSANDAAWQEAWRSFEKSLRTEARFFSRAAAALLSSIFGGIESVRTRDGLPLVVDAGPGTDFGSFYRARVFQSNSLLEEALCRPDLQLGPPPARLAAAGRMNARGISVFYGSDGAHAAIAEVRPPVGSQVMVAKFDVIRPLRLLNLAALGDVVEHGSIFDQGLIDRMERALFLRSLNERMTRPVMPDDEVFAYLATQAVADFLATEADPALDGIVFPSVQVSDGKLNVVLFHKSARAQALEIPAGTTISARTFDIDEDGQHPDYAVTEELSTETPQPPDSDPFHAFQSWDPDRDWRETTLRIVIDSVKVHQLRAVEFRTDEFEVERHRRQRVDWKF